VVGREEREARRGNVADHVGRHRRDPVLGEDEVDPRVVRNRGRQVVVAARQAGSAADRRPDVVELTRQERVRGGRRRRPRVEVADEDRGAGIGTGSGEELGSLGGAHAFVERLEVRVHDADGPPVELDVHGGPTALEDQAAGRERRSVVPRLGAEDLQAPRLGIVADEQDVPVGQADVQEERRPDGYLGNEVLDRRDRHVVQPALRERVDEEVDEVEGDGRGRGRIQQRARLVERRLLEAHDVRPRADDLVGPRLGPPFGIRQLPSRQRTPRPVSSSSRLCPFLGLPGPGFASRRRLAVKRRGVLA